MEAIHIYKQPFDDFHSNAHLATTSDRQQEKTPGPKAANKFWQHFSFHPSWSNPSSKQLIDSYRPQGSIHLFARGVAFQVFGGKSLIY